MKLTGPAFRFFEIQCRCSRPGNLSGTLGHTKRIWVRSASPSVVRSAMVWSEIPWLGSTRKHRTGGPGRIAKGGDRAVWRSSRVGTRRSSSRRNCAHLQCQSVSRVVIVEWNKKVCWITYWSPYGNPNRDLKYMLNKYGEGVGWNEHEAGYVCIRKDGRVWLRCSAAPAISVETAEYLDAKRAATPRN